MKYWLIPTQFDAVYTGPEGGSCGTFDVEAIGLEAYLAEVREFAQLPVHKPQVVLKPRPPAKPSGTSVKPSAKAVKYQFTKGSQKTRRALRTVFNDDDLLAVAASSYIKGLRKRQQKEKQTEEETAQEVAIALERARETISEWKEYLENLKK